MATVVVYLVVAGVAIAIAWLAAGRHEIAARDPSVDLAEIGNRHVGILGGLAGFAVTGMVLLVTLGRNLPDTSDGAFTTVLVMFFVAYVGFIASCLLFANIPATDRDAAFDVPGVMFGGAAVTQYFTIAVGWYALVPMFETFGLTRLAGIAVWLLAISTIASYGLLATQLHRSGVASPRLIGLIPLLAIGAAVIGAILVAIVEPPSSDSILALTVTAFVLGAPAFALLSGLPVVVRPGRSVPAPVRRFGRLLLVAYAQGAAVFVGFLVVLVVRLA